MLRPRNRQGRGGASQADRGRGRGTSSGRGRDRDRQYGSHSPSSVPSTSQVLPGAFVSIVLKVDQPTGRQVQGVVADVLTAGDHPRGIKVRLVDGRVGRVQRMVSETEAVSGSEGLSGLGRNGESVGQYSLSRPGRLVEGGGGSGGRMRYRDVRTDETPDMPASTYTLDDFLPIGHPLREDYTPQQSISETPIADSICPVCGEFEGDQLAVSHHVNAHFE